MLRLFNCYLISVSITIYIITLHVNFYVSDLQVNGQLFESHATKFHTAFFSAMAVMFGEDRIIATKDSMYNVLYYTSILSS